MGLGKTEFNSLCNAMVSEAINQANAVEFEIDDILAGSHFKASGDSISEQAYLDYIGGYLQEKSLSQKCNAMLKLPETATLLEAAGIHCEDATKTMNVWRMLRNRFAHGLLVINSNSDTVLYHKGYCYDIRSHVDEFFDLNAKVLVIMGAISSLHTEYCGKPVFRREGNDPDHPIFAKSIGTA
ncbi:hypothetical protein [Adlercreutzia sp. ZJ138]|uniref:hypothetical protein n=1 Tax=Adlercreutzia sp. ZJ138 TaxID=2709405 RepID=UPI0013EA4B7F|nr:hypothetical protein [Adlercreutzia sp. ZJ138]